MEESTSLENVKTGEKEKQVCFFKAKVLEVHDSEEINNTIKKAIDNQSIVFTDKSTSYVDSADFVELYMMGKGSKKPQNQLQMVVFILKILMFNYLLMSPIHRI